MMQQEPRLPAAPGDLRHLDPLALTLDIAARLQTMTAAFSDAQAGVTHLAAWSYDGGGLLDTVLAEDPAKVWAATARTFKRLRA